MTIVTQGGLKVANLWEPAFRRHWPYCRGLPNLPTETTSLELCIAPRRSLRRADYEGRLPCRSTASKRDC